MRVLFLDYDGVLNSHQMYLMRDVEAMKVGKATPEEADLEANIVNMDAYNVWNLKFILDNVPDLKIVIHSSRRRGHSCETLTRSLEHFGINREVVLGCCPRKMSSQKADDIGFWFHDYADEGGPPVDDWIVVDDRRIFMDADPRRQREYKTSPFTGLTYPDACSIIRKFEPKWEQPGILI